VELPPQTGRGRHGVGPRQAAIEINVFFLLSKTLDALLSPLTWTLVLVAVGMGKNNRWFVAAGMGVLLLFSFEPFENALLSALERGTDSTYRADVTYDALILLGGAVERAAEPGRPSYNDNVERLLETYDLLRLERARFAIVSGGGVDSAMGVPVEADVLAKQLVDWGIAPERVIVEPTARNTHENAVESRRIAKERDFARLLVITSAYHMPRALGCFRAVGLAVDVLPVDYRAYDTRRFSGSWLPRSAYLERSTMVLREWFGRRVYNIRGYAR
jgi:uncharacterized SAM-binding protein YcdF (DUF218 family)